MLHRRPVFLLGLRDRIAQSPESLRLRLAGGDCGILDRAFGQRRLQRLLQRRRLGAGRGHLDQDVPGMATGERRARSGNMLQHQIERARRHQLEALDRIAERPLGLPQQAECGLGRVEADPGDRARSDRGHEPQAGRGHDAQRPLRPDQQLGEIVAAIVFLEGGEAVEDRAVGQHRFEAGDEAPHSAEAQHLRTAGIGRDETADCCRAPRAQGKREAPPRLGGRRVEIGEDDAGLGDGEVGVGVHRPDPVHPPQREQQRRAALVRSRAAHHRGVAALRH